MPTERITFPEINCAVLSDDTAADELCEALVCKIEADVGVEGDGALPLERARVERIVGQIVHNLTKYLEGDAFDVIQAIIDKAIDKAAAPPTDLDSRATAVLCEIRELIDVHFTVLHDAPREESSV